MNKCILIQIRQKGFLYAGAKILLVSNICNYAPTLNKIVPCQCKTKKFFKFFMHNVEK